MPSGQVVRLMPPSDIVSVPPRDFVKRSTIPSSAPLSSVSCVAPPASITLEDLAHVEEAFS